MSLDCFFATEAIVFMASKPGILERSWKSANLAFPDLLKVSKKRLNFLFFYFFYFFLQEQQVLKESLGAISCRWTSCEFFQSPWVHLSPPYLPNIIKLCIYSALWWDPLRMQQLLSSIKWGDVVAIILVVLGLEKWSDRCYCYSPWMGHSLIAVYSPLPPYCIVKCPLASKLLLPIYRVYSGAQRPGQDLDLGCWIGTPG